jgi:hypothetical protein
MGVPGATGASATPIVEVSMGITLLDAPNPTQVPADDADALYRDREFVPSAIRAVELWTARLAADPGDFEAAWKLARGQYWLGTHGAPQAQRKASLDAGLRAARAAAALEPKRPEGHFWMAAHMGALAESFGMRQGLRYRKPIKASLDIVRALDPGYLQGSADRALGRWYFKVPGMLGGSLTRSEAHLRTALSYNEASIITRVFLAETLEAQGDRDAARQQLRTALDTPVDPDWAPEDRRFKQQAEQLLQKLSR